MTVDRDQDFQAFRMWMDQLNHEDYLILGRVALSMVSQPAFVLGYILAKHFNISPIPESILWLNLGISIIIYISLLAALRVYLETRLKIRTLLVKHPDFPMRRLPNIRPGFGLYAPVGIGLIMVLMWSSFLSLEVGPNGGKVATAVTGFLALAGVVFAIGVGMTLSREQTSAADPETPPATPPIGGRLEE